MQKTEQYTASQMTHDLRRLRLNGLIFRSPRTNRWTMRLGFIRRFSRQYQSAAVSGLAIAALTFASYRLHFNAATVVLLYLLVVVLQSLAGGFLASAIIAVAAAGCLDFFFLPAFRMGLAASLKTSGYLVHLARNAEEAVDYVRERPVDIVVPDINMPEVGGVEACKHLRSVAPRSGIDMLTVRDAEDDKVHALRAGADDYIAKPFRLPELIARMGAVLRRPASRPRKRRCFKPAS